MKKVILRLVIVAMLYLTASPTAFAGVAGMKIPDSRVDPGGKSFRTLNPDSGTKGDVWSGRADRRGLDGFALDSGELSLDVDVTDERNETNPAFVLQFDPPALPESLTISGWQFLYPEDPDLTNTFLRFSMLAPEGISDYGLELLDADGRFRGWYDFDPTNVWQERTVLPDVAAAQGFDLYSSDADFDITQVVGFQFVVATVPGATFPISDPTGSGSAWAAWEYVQVAAVPEPASLAIFGLGLLGLVAGGIRRRKRTA